MMYCVNFCRHGKIQSVKLLPSDDANKAGAVVAFMDIKSASKAHNCENKLDGTVLLTQYSELPGTAPAVTITRTRLPDNRQAPPSAGATPSAPGPPTPSGSTNTDTARGLYSQRNVTSSRYSSRPGDTG